MDQNIKRPAAWLICLAQLAHIAGSLPEYRQLHGGRWVIEATESERFALLSALKRTAASDCGKDIGGCPGALPPVAFGDVLRVDRAHVPLTLDGKNGTIPGGVHIWHNWRGADSTIKVSADDATEQEAMLADLSLGLKMQHMLDDTQVEALRQYVTECIQRARELELVRLKRSAGARASTAESSSASAQSDASNHLVSWLHQLGDLGAMGRKLIWLPLWLTGTGTREHSNAGRSIDGQHDPATENGAATDQATARLSEECVLFLRPVGDGALEAFIGADGGRIISLASLLAGTAGGNSAATFPAPWQRLPAQHWILDQVLGDVGRNSQSTSATNDKDERGRRARLREDVPANVCRNSCVPVIVPDRLPHGDKRGAAWSPPPSTAFVMIVSKIETVNPVSVDDTRAVDDVIAEAARLRADNRQRRWHCRRRNDLQQRKSHKLSASGGTHCVVQRLRIGLLLLGDQFGEIPHSLYSVFDVVLRQHYFESHVGAAEIPVQPKSQPRHAHPHPHVHWILLGPSLGAPFRSTQLLQKERAWPSGSTAPIMVSQREIVGSFVGNVSPLVCRNAEELCYKTPERASLALAMRLYAGATSAMANVTGKNLTLVTGDDWLRHKRRHQCGVNQTNIPDAVHSKLLLHATDKYQGMDSIFRAEQGDGTRAREASVAPLSPTAFRVILENTVLALCPPASGTVESTRVYEALEAGAVPVIHGPPRAMAFPACAPESDCPLPLVSGNWSVSLPKVLKELGWVHKIGFENHAVAALDELQLRASRWYARLKENKAREVGNAINALMVSDARSGDDSVIDPGVWDGQMGTPTAPIGAEDIARASTYHPYRSLLEAGQLIQRGDSSALASARAITDGTIAHLQRGCRSHRTQALHHRNDGTGLPPTTTRNATLDTRSRRDIGKNFVFSADLNVASWCWSHELHHALTMRGMVSSALFARALRGQYSRRRPGNGYRFAELGRDALRHYEIAAFGWLVHMEVQIVRFPMISSSLPNAAVTCLQLRDMACARRHLELALRYDGRNPELLKTKVGLLELEGRMDEVIQARQEVAQALRDARDKRWRTLSFDTAKLWQGL